MLPESLHELDTQKIMPRLVPKMGKQTNKLDDSPQRYQFTSSSSPPPIIPLRRRIPIRRVIEESSHDESTMPDHGATASESPSTSSGPTLARKQAGSNSILKNNSFLTGNSKNGSPNSRGDLKSNVDLKYRPDQRPQKPSFDRQISLRETIRQSDGKTSSSKPNSSKQSTVNGGTTTITKEQSNVSSPRHGKAEKSNATVLPRDVIEQAIESQMKEFTSSNSILTNQLLNRAKSREELGLEEHDFGEDLKNIRSGPTSMNQKFVQKKSPFAALKPLSKNEHPTSTSKNSNSVETIALSSGASKKGSKKKSVHRSKISASRYMAEAVDLPLFYNHTPLSRSVLAPNNRILTYWPPTIEEKAVKNSTWNPVEEELQELFPDERKSKRPEVLRQREKAKQLWPSIEKAFQQLGVKQSHIWSFLQNGLEQSTIESNKLKAEQVNLHRQSLEESGMLRDLMEWIERRTKNDENDADTCSETQRFNVFMACRTLLKELEIPMLQFERARAVAAESTSTTMRSIDFYESKSCSVCQLQECPYHGEYLEEYSDVEGGAQVEDDVRAMSEVQADNVNHRLRMNVATSDHSPGQVKLAYTDTISLQEQLGLEADGEARGKWNGPHEDNKATGYEDDQVCSERCFWKKTNRKGSLATAEWSSEDLKYLEKLLPTFGESKRGPCFLALALEKSCVEVYFKLRSLSRKYRQTSVPNKEAERSIQKRPLTYWLNNSETALLHQRLPFYPCRHPGSTCEEEKCRCFMQGINCEKSCLCSSTCVRRFRGCKCARSGNICWKNSNCDCFRLNRECDADLCGTCGAADVLDPMHRHDHEIVKKRCANVSLQRNVSKCTRVGISDVSGFGLFMGESAKRGEFIGEYKGHLMSAPETHRRGSVYQHGELTYLFRLTSAKDPKSEFERGHEMDGMLASSKTRFINNSRLNKNINVVVKLLLANQVVRLAMFAGRDVKPGEELFFDYQLPKDHHSKLWEKGEKSNDITAARHQLIFGQSAASIGGPLPSGAAGLTNSGTPASSNTKKLHGLNAKQAGKRKVPEDDKNGKDGNRKPKKDKGKNGAGGENDPNQALEASDYDDWHSFFEDPILLQQVSDSADEDYREEGENSAVEYTPRKRERERRRRTRRDSRKQAQDAEGGGIRNLQKRKSPSELDGSFEESNQQVSAGEGHNDDDISSKPTENNAPPTARKRSKHAPSAASKARPGKTGRQQIPGDSDVELESPDWSDIQTVSKTTEKIVSTKYSSRKKVTAKKKPPKSNVMIRSSGVSATRTAPSKKGAQVSDSSDAESESPVVSANATIFSKKRKKEAVTEGADEDDRPPSKKSKTNFHKNATDTRSKNTSSKIITPSNLPPSKMAKQSNGAQDPKPEQPKGRRRTLRSSRARDAGLSESDIPPSTSSDPEPQNDIHCVAIETQSTSANKNKSTPAKNQKRTPNTPADKQHQRNGSAANTNEQASSSQLVSTGDSGRSRNYRRIVIDSGSGSDSEGPGNIDEENGQLGPSTGRRGKRLGKTAPRHLPNGDDGDELSRPSKATKRKRPMNGEQKESPGEERDDVSDDEDESPKLRKSIRKVSNRQTKEHKDDESPKATKSARREPPGQKRKH